MNCYKIAKSIVGESNDKFIKSIDLSIFTLIINKIYWREKKIASVYTTKQSNED